MKSGEILNQGLLRPSLRFSIVRPMWSHVNCWHWSTMCYQVQSQPSPGILEYFMLPSMDYSSVMRKMRDSRTKQCRWAEGWYLSILGLLHTSSEPWHAALIECKRSPDHVLSAYTVQYMDIQFSMANVFYTTGITLYVLMPHFFTLSSFSTATPRETSSVELVLWFSDP